MKPGDPPKFPVDGAGWVNNSMLGAFLGSFQRPAEGKTSVANKIAYDFQQLSPSPVYDAVEKEAEKLADAIDPKMSLTLQGVSKETDCDSMGCWFKTTIYSPNEVPIWVKMYVKFFLGGVYTGLCETAVQQVAARGLLNLECSNAGATRRGKPVTAFSEVYAAAPLSGQAKEQADQLHRQRTQDEALRCARGGTSCTNPFDDLARYQAPSVARLDVNGNIYYGTSERKRAGDRAAADALQQAQTANIFAPTAVLYLNAPLCESCGDLAKIRSRLQETNITQVLVATPDGRVVLVVQGGRPVQITPEPDPIDCVAAGNSFVAGTPVLLADGTSKPIEAVAVGDVVQAGDPVTGVTRAEPVTDLIRHSGPHLMVDIGLVDGATLRATDNHPFWNVTAYDYVDAIDLHVGDKLLANDGRPVTVTSLTTDWADLTAYNLTVADLHTYYVLAGDTPVLVHNQGSRTDPINFGNGYTGRLDQYVSRGGQTSFEIHVYRKGKEYGFYGSNGWFSKHTLPVPTNVPQELEKKLKERAIDFMRRSGQLGPNDNVEGDNWKRPRIEGGC